MQVSKVAVVALLKALGLPAADKLNDHRLVLKLAKLPELVDEDTNLPEQAELIKTCLANVAAGGTFELVDDAPATPAPAAPEAPVDNGVADVKPSWPSAGVDASPDSVPVAPATPATPAKAKGKGKKATPAAAGVQAAEDIVAADKATPAKGKGKKAKAETAPATAPAMPAVEAPKAATPKAPAAPKVKPVPTEAWLQPAPGIRPTTARAFYAGVLVKRAGLAAGITEEMILALDKLVGTVNPVQSRYDLSHAWHALNGATNYPKEMVDQALATK